MEEKGTEESRGEGRPLSDGGNHKNGYCSWDMSLPRNFLASLNPIEISYYDSEFSCAMMLTMLLCTVARLDKSVCCIT
jgi:hypothetical protein